MSNGYYESYEQERKRKAEERKAAPNRCPHCNTPINEHLSEYNSTVRQNCGATACRSAAYRKRSIERRQAARQDADTRINCYVAGLPADQAATVRMMRDVLMGKVLADTRHGHEQALAVIEVIDDQRCKHDRIADLLAYASAAKRRADEAEAYNRELQAIYKQRIAELQSELSVYQLLEGAVHRIATQQLQQQPDPPKQPIVAREDDSDRDAMLATLAQARIAPYTGRNEDEEE